MRSAVGALLMLGGVFLFTFGMVLAVDGDSDGMMILTTSIFTFVGGLGIGAGGWILWREGWLR